MVSKKNMLKVLEKNDLEAIHGATLKVLDRGKQPNFGYSDWRLPSLTELRSLQDFTNYTGDRKYFPPEGHPFQHVQAMNLEKYYQWPTYFWNPKLSWINSAYCRLVGRNAGVCVGFVWAVRGGRKD